MARLIFPEAFEEQRTLLGLVRAKHNADGGASVLTPFLTEKSINLNNDFTAGNSAQTHHASAKLFARQAENFVQQRNLKFEPVFKNTRAEVQFLKTFFKPNVQALGDWGVTVDNNSRISYPPEFAGRVTIVRAIKTKHDTYPPLGQVSPLTPYLNEHNINIGQDATATTNAETLEAQQLDARRDAEEETEVRNVLWSPVIDHLQAVGDYLMKLFNGSQKKLGEWGFMVDNSPRKPKLVTITLLPATQKTTSSIVLGGTFTNIGSVLLHVYKGKVTSGTPITVNPTEKLGMIKGFSVITIINPNTLEKGKCTVLKHQ